MIRAAPERVALVIGSLQCGGAERNLSFLANAWTRAGREVTVLPLDDRAPFFPLDDGVVVRPLSLTGRSAGAIEAVASNLRRLRALRRAVRAARPDVVVSFLAETNVLTLLATRGLGVPVVVAERSYPGLCPVRPSWGLLRRLTYPHASCVVGQTRRALAWFGPSIAARGRVIPNPVAPFAAPRRRACGDGGRVAALGRLVPEKGYDTLLHAFAAAARPGWELAIHGEGPDRARLEALRDELGLAGRAHLPGTARGPGAAFADADLFALTSRFEGFPNALLEAMAAGLPVVSADCPCGPAEIVRDGVDGVLVPPGDGDAFAAALGALMDDPARRDRLGTAARDVVRRFSVPAVLDRWERVLAEVRGG